MDPVHGGGPWTRGPCFVLSRQEKNQAHQKVEVQLCSVGEPIAKQLHDRIIKHKLQNPIKILTYPGLASLGYKQPGPGRAQLLALAYL